MQKLVAVVVPTVEVVGWGVINQVVEAEGGTNTLLVVVQLLAAGEENRRKARKGMNQTNLRMVRLWSSGLSHANPKNMMSRLQIGD
jgi:hypothetical protein